MKASFFFFVLGGGDENYIKQLIEKRYEDINFEQKPNGKVFFKIYNERVVNLVLDEVKNKDVAKYNALHESYMKNI